MDALKLPTFDVKISTEEGTNFIYDQFRRKYVVLTPEEWVRQHMVHYLVTHLHYPKGLVKLEGGMNYLQKAKRTDVLVLNNEGKPLLLVECKAASVKLTQQVCAQLSTYNAVLKAPYAAITNGRDCFCWQLNSEQRNYTALPQIPDYTAVF